MNKNELENFVLTQYDAEIINTLPKTEKELLKMYQQYTDILYQYLRVTVDGFLHTLNNEIRALVGHLAEYRTFQSTFDKRELYKAYGHFRRLNLDSLKILCDEFDRTLSMLLKKQYGYDYRNVCVDYLKKYGEKYFAAKQAYMNAQQKERVGSDSYKHNIIALYYDAAKKYIALKQYYEENKKDILKEKRKTNIKRIFNFFAATFGIVVTVLDFLV